jgi:hypothetical protein
MFFVYGAKCLSRKAVHNCVEKFSEGRTKVADDARPRAEMAETTVKRLQCCGFRRIGKAMGQVYQWWWKICREINVFSQVLMLHVLRFIFICDLFTDSPMYNMILPISIHTGDIITSRNWCKCKSRSKHFINSSRHIARIFSEGNRHGA